MKNAVLIQQAFSNDKRAFDGHQFFDCMRLTYPRHSAYALAHEMDYWHIIGDVYFEYHPGGWGKIHMMITALKKGYEHVFWVDSDAAIMDMEVDLRDCLKGKKFHIGACVHDANNIAAHMNIGVLYVRNKKGAKEFLEDWAAMFPGQHRWMEQGAFNKLIKGRDVVGQVEDKWNATVNVNMVDKPVVKGWLGVAPADARFQMMRAELINDYIVFRI